MPRKKRETEMEETIEYPNTNTEPYCSDCFELTAGFYLLDGNRNLKTKQVTKGKPGETRRVETEPIRCRTIQGAKDVVEAADNPLGILCVTETLLWPVQ